MEDKGVRKKKKKKKAKGEVHDLAMLLRTRDIDVARFEPIGAGFYQQYEDIYNASVVCIDKLKLFQGQPYLVKIVLEDFTNDEFLLLRKKFELIINPEYRSYYSLNIDGIIMQSNIDKK